TNGCARRSGKDQCCEGREFKMQCILKVFVPLCFGVLALSSLQAQDISKGSIAGVIRDPSGGVIPDTKVTLSSPYGERSATTNVSGAYVFPNLVVGSGYTVSAERPGFRLAKVSDVVVRVNQQTTVDFKLEVGEISQTVEVSAPGIEGIDLSTTTVGSNINESVYKNVAIERNVSALVAMAPGVADGVGTGAANPSINGASGLENQYIVNGANVTDPGFGGFGTYSRVFGSLGNGVNFDFIQEV